MECVENSDQLIKDEEKPVETAQEEIETTDEKQKCYTCNREFTLFELEIHFNTCDGLKESIETTNQPKHVNNLIDQLLVERFEKNIVETKVVDEQIEPNFPLKESEKLQKIENNCNKRIESVSKSGNETKLYDVTYSNDSKIFECKECKAKFHKFTSFHLHYKSVHKEKTFKCEKCTKLFAYKSKLGYHQQKCNGEKPKCQKCNDIFPNNWPNWLLQNHVNSCDGKIRSRKCSHCNKKFHSYNGMRIHVKRKHNLPLSKKENPKCEKCHDIFHNDHMLQKHVKSCDGKIRSHKCPHCQKIFHSREGIKRHFKIIHNLNYDVKVFRKERPRCEKCHDSFSNIRALHNHANSCDGSIKSKKCTNCSKTFHSNFGLRRHVQRRHSGEEESLRYQCDSCSKKFLSLATLIYHDSIHHLDTDSKNKMLKVITKSVKGYKCENCPEKHFRSVSKGTLHYYHIHKDGRYNCQKCSLTFLFQSQCKKHDSKCRRNKTHKCNNCDEMFSSKRSLLVHVSKNHRVRKVLDSKKSLGVLESKNDHSRKVFDSKRSLEVLESKNQFVRKDKTCDVCNKVFKGAAYVKRHIAIVHTKEKIHECQLCSKKFKTLMTLNFHHSLVHKEKDLTCHICGESFRLGFQLKAHIDSIHDGMNKCEICKKSWVNRQSYTEHMKNVHGEIIVRVSNQELVEKCKICEKVFSKDAIENHISIEHDKTQSQCESCGVVLDSTFELNVHMKIEHHGNDNTSFLNDKDGKSKKYFNCTQCEKVFAFSSGLSQHKRFYHGKEIDKECKKCNKVFSNANNLNTHVQSNHENRRFNCDNCEKSFTFSSGLSKHKRFYHSKESDTQCKQCNKVFSTTQSLNTHFQSVHENIRFNCDNCEKSFTFPSGLSQHKKFHHGKDMKITKC